MTIPDSTLQEIQRDVSLLPKGLCEHILRVKEIAVALAEAHGIDTRKVRVSALLHDMARATRPEELISLAETYGIEVGPLEARMPIFLHGPVAAAQARERYAIRDPETLEAVTLHTTGSAGMGPVARVVFLADKLDPAKDRRYPFNPQVRQAAETDLNTAMRLFLDGEISGHVAGGRVVHPAGISLRNELL